MGLCVDLAEVYPTHVCRTSVGRCRRCASLHSVIRRPPWTCTTATRLRWALQAAQEPAVTHACSLPLRRV